MNFIGWIICFQLFIISAFQIFTKAKFTKQKSNDTMRVFLDHNDYYYHAETFYSVAYAVIQLHPAFSKFHFIVNNKFAAGSGLNKMWDQYSTAGTIKRFSYSFREEYSTLYSSLLGEYLSTDDNLQSILNFDIRVLITLPIQVETQLYDILVQYKNNVHYMFILHHMEANVFNKDFTTWNNIIHTYALYQRTKYDNALFCQFFLTQA
jgi:hypothetical protein